MFRLSEISTEEEPLIKAGCYINHFTNTRPFGIVLDSPRILIPATSLGLAFALPYVFREKRVLLHVYDLWRNNRADQIETFVDGLYFNQFVYITSGVYHKNTICAVGVIKPYTMLCLCLTLKTLKWHVKLFDTIICIRPIISSKPCYQLIQTSRTNMEMWRVFQSDENGRVEYKHQITLPCSSINVVNQDMFQGDIDGLRLLYDSDEKRCWFFCFRNTFMNRVYYCDLTPFDSNVNGGESDESANISWHEVNLNSNAEFVCPASVEYSKCFIRRSVVYWFMPYDERTSIWTLNLQHPEDGWSLLMENLPFTVIDPVHDRVTDDLLFYCAKVSPKTREYPWDPCWMCVRRAFFTVPTLQSLALATVGKHLKCKKVCNKTLLTDSGIAPTFAHGFWERTVVLKRVLK